MIIRSNGEGIGRLFGLFARQGFAALAVAIAILFAPATATATDKADAPIPPAVMAALTAKGSTPSAPLVLRSYKKEAEIEVWKANGAGRFVFIKSFPICRWSGQLGPKRYSGDRQTPEGFYQISAKQMNPNSHYYLSFDTGFPNAFDKAQGATGSAVMVHGTCSSMGCFAMTDRVIGELYSIARDALKGGQPSFQLQAYPFHMTAKNMALYRDDPNIAFWRQLKEGSDRFEATGEALVVGVANGRYTFAASPDKQHEAAFHQKHDAELATIDGLVRDGSAAIRTTYADGGQNAIFAALRRKGENLGVVSRPEALAYAAIDTTLVPARPHRRPATPLTIDAAEWVPEHKQDIQLVKAHTATAMLDPVALSAQPQAPLPSRPAAALIAGASPIRGANWAN